MRGKKYKDVAIKYAKDVVNGDIIAGIDRINACKRFLDDLERPELELRDTQPDAAITIIENMFVLSLVIYHNFELLVFLMIDFL